VVPFLLGLFFVFLPRIDRSRSPGGIWLAGDRRRLGALFFAILLSQILFIVVGQWLRGSNWSLIWPF
jgi:hypothetical protein